MSEPIRNKDGLTEEEFLAQYNPSDYERPSVTVDMMVLCMSKHLENMKILLIQRGDHPFINQWALAGGFVDIKESTYQAACRELEEETGLKNIYLEQLYTMSQPDRDPRMRVITVSYIALINEQEVKAGDDAKNALWFDIVKFTNSRLILHNSDEDITIDYKLNKKYFKNGVITVEGLVPEHFSGEKLAADHVNISDVAFNLLPKVFSIADLRRVYEIILGKELYKTNFKKHVEDKLDNLDYKVTPLIKGGKFSQAYKYRG